MYRLLVVDDEEIIVNGLYEVFSGLENLELDVYKAYSGAEAIQWLNRTRIDIALTDINMPEMDGLKLLDEIKSRWPWCRVIFLTGHSEFHYAYKAIQYHHVRYILKTEGYEKIISTVTDVVQELTNENQANELIQNAKDQINLAQDLFCQKYFWALLNKDSSLKIDAEEFGRLFIRLKVDEPLFMILGEILISSSTVDFWEKNQIMYSIKQLIIRRFSMHVNSLVVPIQGDKIAVFVQPGHTLMQNAEHITENTVVFIKGTLDMIQSDCRKKLNAPINFALAETWCNWADAAEKYVSLIDLLNYRIGTTMETIIDEGEFRKQVQIFAPVSENNGTTAKTLLQGLLYRKDLGDMQQSLESGEQQLFFDLLQKWLEPLGKTEDKSDAIALEAYQTIITFFLSYLNRTKLTARFSESYDLKKLNNCDNYDSWREASNHLLELSHTLFDIQNKEQCQRTTDTIDLVQQYIKSHLAEDLSLTNLSEKIYLNPSYLSRLYHQTTGHKLSGFIERVRLKEAKDLLENSHDKIYEIAKKVGYDTAASFTRFFRKAEGVSPLEFRDAYLATQMSNNMK